jgi:hypothetical protein
MAFAAAASQGHALTIMGTFDSTITGRSDAAAIEAQINTAMSFYSVFSNPATVNILFQMGNTGLGGSSTGLYADPYATYVGYLAADAALHPENTVLPVALANIASDNHKDEIAFTSANGRALGQNTPGAVTAAHYDGVVTLSNTPGLISFGDTVGPSQYAAMPVIQHEIDEVLGVGGPGSLVSQPFGPDPFHNGSTYMGAEDLYRFAGVHTPSFTDGQAAYFSIDGGVTNIMGFHADSHTGDNADWIDGDCSNAHVQDFQGCPGHVPYGLTLSSPEVIALQAIGYNIGVPEPSTWAMLIAGFGMAGAALRRRRVAMAVA